ncbi:MAG: hypothetical protein AB1485_04160 [Candidatus Thermoplasmatota archaeon]
MGLEKERKIEEQKRLEAQKERIEKQREIEISRALEAFKRGGMPESEIKKRAHELSWRGKWDRRLARWEARARKYEIK